MRVGRWRPIWTISEFFGIRDVFLDIGRLGMRCVVAVDFGEVKLCMCLFGTLGLVGCVGKVGSGVAGELEARG